MKLIQWGEVLIDGAPEGATSSEMIVSLDTAPAAAKAVEMWGNLVG